MSGKMATDPFSSQDILNWPVPKDNQYEAWPGFVLDNTSQSQSLHLASIQEVTLPSLNSSTFQLSSEENNVIRIDEEETKDSLLPETPNTTDTASEVSFDNLWSLDEVEEKQGKDLLVSWDQWMEPDKPSNDYGLFSEAETSVYDFVNSHIWQESRSEPLKFAAVGPFQKSLINLLLGRSSTFFEWNNSQLCFAQRASEYALTGFTQGIVQSTCDLFIECGNTIRRLLCFTQTVLDHNPSLHALQSSISQVLHLLEHECISRQLHKLTIIQLTDVAQTILDVVKLLDSVRIAIPDHPGESDVLTAAVTKMDEIWISEEHHRPLLTKMSIRILQPAIDATLKVIESRNGADNKEQKWALAGLLPTYCSMFDEIIGNASFVQTCFQGLSTDFAYIPSPRIIRNWSEVQHVVQAAEKWETQRVQLLVGKSDMISKNIELEPQHEQDISINPFAINFICEPVENLSADVREEKRFANAVACSVRQVSTHSVDDLSPLQALEQTIIPSLKAQHRISSYALMRALFLEHNITAHLSQLHSYQLLGDGIFATRLSRALFSSEQNSAEGLRKTGLSSGLRIEDREVWPPASSELRLVLMNLLSETSPSETPDETSRSTSFAIRELAERELNLCRDVHSIHALDFLCLVYTPTHPLVELIITTTSLKKYDRIFKFLLLLLRIHSLTQHQVTVNVCHRSDVKITPAWRRLCFELHHFITSLTSYAFDIALAVPWRRFTDQTSSIHQSVLDGAYSENLDTIGSVVQFRQLHEGCLDECLRSLLLKNKQQKAYEIICDIFSLVLKIATLTDGRTDVQDVQKQRKEYLRLFGALVAQIQSISNMEDPALKRLTYLQLQIDGAYLENC